MSLDLNSCSSSTTSIRHLRQNVNLNPRIFLSPRPILLRQNNSFDYAFSTVFVKNKYSFSTSKFQLTNCPSKCCFRLYREKCIFWNILMQQYLYCYDVIVTMTIFLQTSHRDTQKILVNHYTPISYEIVGHTNCYHPIMIDTRLTIFNSCQYFVMKCFVHLTINTSHHLLSELFSITNKKNSFSSLQKTSN